EVDPNVIVIGERVHNLANRRCGTALAPDHLAEVSRVDPHLVERSAAQFLGTDIHVVGVSDDPADEVLDHVANHAGQPFVESAEGSACSAVSDSAGASSAAASAVLESDAGSCSAACSVAPPAGFFADFFCVLVTASAFGSPCTCFSASLKISALSRLDSATFRASGSG